MKSGEVGQRQILLCEDAILFLVYFIRRSNCPLCEKTGQGWNSGLQLEADK